MTSIVKMLAAIAILTPVTAHALPPPHYPPGPPYLSTLVCGETLQTIETIEFIDPDAGEPNFYEGDVILPESEITLVVPPRTKQCVKVHFFVMVVSSDCEDHCEVVGLVDGVEMRGHSMFDNPVRMFSGSNTFDFQAYVGPGTHKISIRLSLWDDNTTDDQSDIVVSIYRWMMQVETSRFVWANWKN